MGEKIRVWAWAKAICGGETEENNVNFNGALGVGWLSCVHTHFFYLFIKFYQTLFDVFLFYIGGWC